LQALETSRTSVPVAAMPAAVAACPSVRTQADDRGRCNRRRYDRGGLHPECRTGARRAAKTISGLGSPSPPEKRARESSLALVRPDTAALVWHRRSSLSVSCNACRRGRGACPSALIGRRARTVLSRALRARWNCLARRAAMRYPSFGSSPGAYRQYIARNRKDMGINPHSNGRRE
jgi:hypothetical protein